LTPAYDKQENIYNDLLVRVDNGIANVTTNAGSNPGAADVIYKGHLQNGLPLETLLS
jgi:hypothetical protein